MPVERTRRQVLTEGTALGWFLLAGSWTQTTAAVAQAKGFDPQVLSAQQCDVLATLADALVPGARTAGIAPYVDSQLAAGNNSLLMAKYVGVPPDQQRDFYTAALNNAAALLAMPNITLPALIADMARDTVVDWPGPPASYVSFVLRADALDVVYGTPQGFEALDIPYMAHIYPTNLW